MSGSDRERLQIGRPGRRLCTSSMNDFPIPEDPPVTTTAEKHWSASRGEGTEWSVGVKNFARDTIALARSTQTQRRNMNSQNNNELIVSGIHLDLTPSLKTFVREKADRLFRHDERIVRIRVELECDAKEGVATRFKAKGRIVIQGPDMNATVQADECHKAVALLIDKLDRMLGKRHYLHKAKRHQLRPVEFHGVALPKAG